MNHIFLYIIGVIFLAGVLLRICFALFFPDKFADGARKVLFLDEREKALFRPAKSNLKHYKNKTENHDH